MSAENFDCSTSCHSVPSSSVSVSLPQQTLPVDLSNSGIRGTGGASFHGSTSAFDPCCPGSSSRPPNYVSHATPGPSQPAVVDSFGSSMVAQPQTQPQTCRHYMHPSCEYRKPFGFSRPSPHPPPQKNPKSNNRAPRLFDFRKESAKRSEAVRCFLEEQLLALHCCVSLFSTHLSIHIFGNMSFIDVSILTEPESQVLFKKNP